MKDHGTLFSVMLNDKTQRHYLFFDGLVLGVIDNELVERAYLESARDILIEYLADRGQQKSARHNVGRA